MTNTAIDHHAERLLTVVIADGASLARARLRRLLASDSRVRIVAECADTAAATAAIFDHKPDVVFLDVQMPDLACFTALESLTPAETPQVVFAMAFDRSAVEAFGSAALDYLLKPFDAERLRATLDRARERHADPRGRRELIAAIRDFSATRGASGVPAPEEPHRYLDRMSVKVDGRIMFIRVADVDYFEAAANYVRIHVNGAKHLIRERISELAGHLDPETFARIHRSTIINVHRIKEVQPWFSGDAVVVLHSGQRVRLSRQYRPGLAFLPSRRAARAE